LDRAELLFPWQQQKARLLRRKQEEDMDSDSDMIDETVKIPKKRSKRDSESTSDNTVDNYETLNTKWTQMNEELCQLRIKLAKIGAQNDIKPDFSQEFDDELDNFMASIGKQKYGLSMSDKIEKSNIKMKITQLEKEQQKLEKLIKLAKPTIAFQDVSDSSSSISTKETDKLNKVENKNLRDISTPSSSVTNAETDNKIIKIEENNNEKQDLKGVEENTNKKENKEKIIEQSNDEKQKIIDRNQIILQKTESIINDMKTEKQKHTQLKSKQKMRAQSIVEAIEKEKKLEEDKTKQKPTYDSDYVDWLPPSGQSGDGKTRLNEKFGY